MFWIAGLSLLLFGTRNPGVLISLVTFVMAIQRHNNTFGSFAGSLGSLTTNAATMDLLNKLLESNDKQFCRRGGLTFKSLPPALHTLNLDIPRGSTITCNLTKI
jgi:hypothetical protein